MPESIQAMPYILKLNNETNWNALVVIVCFEFFLHVSASFFLLLLQFQFEWCELSYYMKENEFHNKGEKSECSQWVFVLH